MTGELPWEAGLVLAQCCSSAPGDSSVIPIRSLVITSNLRAVSIDQKELHHTDEPQVGGGLERDGARLHRAPLVLAAPDGRHLSEVTQVYRVSFLVEVD